MNTRRHFRHPHSIAVLGVIAAALLMINLAIAGKPAPPEPPPCAGNPIEVINEDLCGMSMAIAVDDSTAVCNILCVTNEPSKPKDRWTCPVYPLSWIGGIVIVDPEAEHGFRFDPNTIVVAEVTAEGLQTSICQIAANPSMYAGGRWYVHANITSVTE